MKDLIKVKKGNAHMTIDVDAVVKDQKAFAEASDYMYGMFDREVYDVVICVDTAGSYFADAVAKRMNKKLVCMWDNPAQTQQPIVEYSTHHSSHRLTAPPEALSKGQKAVIITDVLSHGKDVQAAVKIAESQGVNVIKVGVFVEDRGFNARKKLLKGIPVECMFPSDDL